MKTETSQLSFRPLTDKELNDLFDDIDLDNDGLITFEELEEKLEQVHLELAPEPKKHHLNHPSNRRIRSNQTNADPEKGRPARDPEHDGLHTFLCNLMPSCGASMGKEEFLSHVKSWNVPSQSQASAEEEDENDVDYESHLPLVRRLQARWSVGGPQILFISAVISLQLAFGIWQMVKYIKDPQARAALGWGVIVAKACAGALYPTLYLMILSMSRWFSTTMRRFHRVSRVINWDRSQSFHIWMACIGLALATLHGIGHMTGTFLYGSRPAQQGDLLLIVGPDAVPKPYIGFVRTLPGWSGIISLGLYWSIALLSLPIVRKWSYEVFQLGHLLMFPMIGFLCAHGTAKILQAPMVGYWLAFPSLLVVLERLHRVLRGFFKIPARMEILDDDTINLTLKEPRGRNWRYSAGQYVLLQVPAISFFQWHPFTISACKEDMLQLHIKTDGGWTWKLRDLPHNQDIYVGIDGPFGAPAQRFYAFDRSLIIGSGIGVTPFSAILTDIEQALNGKRLDLWRSSQRGRSSRRSSRVGSRKSSRATNAASSRSSSVASVARDAVQTHVDEVEQPDQAILPQAHVEPPATPGVSTLNLPPAHSNSQAPSLKFSASASQPPPDQPLRRVDFHWIVREKSALLWFSALLNRALDLSNSRRVASSLDLRIRPHITKRRQNISTHVFRYLLDRYRTPTSPVSALTRLRVQSEFGRPDFKRILREFHEDTREAVRSGDWREGGAVGVFFCGSPVIGRVLSDECAELTARAREDGSRVRYVFMMEVFG